MPLGRSLERGGGKLLFAALTQIERSLLHGPAGSAAIPLDRCQAEGSGGCRGRSNDRLDQEQVTLSSGSDHAFGSTLGSRGRNRVDHYACDKDPLQQETTVCAPIHGRDPHDIFIVWEEEAERTPRPQSLRLTLAGDRRVAIAILRGD